MNAEDILRIAMEQSAEDINCNTDDFLKSTNVIVPFRLGEKARKYLKEPMIADFVSYGNNVVASVREDVKEIAAEYINKYEWSNIRSVKNAIKSGFTPAWVEMTVKTDACIHERNGESE